LCDTPVGTEVTEAPGGFIETVQTGVVRPRPTASALQSLLPARGPFVFPPPYGTEGIRLTNSGDCGGADCVNYVGYSYWRNINHHAGSDELLVFLGLDRSRGGSGPTLFRVNKATGQVTNAGPLFDPSNPLSWSSAEGWYFSAGQPTKIYLHSGSRMLRYDVLSRQSETVFDVAPGYGADKYIWQLHSSDDDQVHSATLRANATGEMLGCLVYHDDTGQFQYFPKAGSFDECHVDKSGRWLVSLEQIDGIYDLDMRVIDLTTGAERVVLDQDGAIGHADVGHGYVIGHDNWYSQPNGVRLWEFTRDPLSGLPVFHSRDWSAPAANHLAHGNARPGVPPGEQFACGSNASEVDVLWANEIVCFRLDGSLEVLVVAPVMTDVGAAGGGDSYGKMPKGNLDASGEYFIWTSNTGTNRLDAFLIRVPGQHLVDLPGDVLPPQVTITAPAPGSNVSGQVAVTADASDDTGVAGLQFRLNGADLGPELSAPPYVVSWDTFGASDGPHQLTAVARDAAGNSAPSVPVDVMVGNGASPAGPIAYWRLDEGSGTTAADAFGSRHGTLAGGTAWTAGVLAQGVALDGIDGHVVVAHDAALDAYPMTLTAWIRTGATALHGVLNKYLPASMNGFQLFTSGGNLCAWYFRDGFNYVWDGSGCTLATPGFNDDQWHHVAFVVDAAGGRLYVDGLLQAARVWTGTPGAATTTADLSFGRYPGIATPFLPGSIDEVGLYNRVLGAAEIAGLATPGADCAPTDPGVWAIPAEVTGLALDPDLLGLGWNSLAAVAGSGTVYDLARGDLQQAAPGQGAGGICLSSGLPDAAGSDPDLPALGSAFWYLVRGRNSCGSGTYGHRSDGVERVIAGCP
jgi:hypothetical protein